MINTMTALIYVSEIPKFIADTQAILNPGKEKSGEAGRRLLRNYIAAIDECVDTLLKLEPEVKTFRFQTVFETHQKYVMYIWVPAMSRYLPLSRKQTAQAIKVWYGGGWRKNGLEKLAN